MSDPLLSRLVDDGVLSRDDAERATERQAQAGGSIDTALLELRLLPGARLSEVLARVTGMPAPPEGAFESPDPRARRVFPARVAERHSIAPFALEGRDLSVVTTYPPDASLLDEIGFLLSLHLRAHVAPEWRVRALVHELYGTALPERLAALRSAPERAKAQPADAAPAAAVPTVSSAPLPPAPPEAAPAPFAAPTPPEARSAPVRRPAPPSAAAPHWSPAQAAEALAGAGDRDEAIRAALRHALDFFSYAAMFSVRRDGLVGHDALGTDPRARDACRRIAVTADDAGLFAAPLTARAPYLGPPPSDPVTESVLSGLGRVGPHTVLVAPVYVGERPACLLYADNDDAPVTSSRLGDLFVTLGALGGSLERMIRSRKTAAGEPRAAPADGTSPEPPPADEAEAPGGELPAASAPVDLAPGPEPVAQAAAPQVPADAADAETEASDEPASVPSPAPPAGSQGDEWRVSEPALVETDPLPFAVDVDLGEYEVAVAAEALASGRAQDLGALVEALAASSRGSTERDQLVAWLSEGGAEAAVALVSRLPGPIEAGEDEAVPVPVDQRGPIFAGTVALGRAAEKPLLATLEDPDPRRRRAAVALVARMGNPANLALIAARVHDEDPRVAAEALEAVVAAKGTPALAPLVGDLRRALGSGRPARVLPAARALGRLGDADAVPLLIQLLERGGEVAAASAEALSRITLQRLGTDPRPWIGWWREWRAAPRSSWLFQALDGPDLDLRRLAASELRRAGEPPVPYRAEASEPDRRRAARAWADWWREEGLAL